MNRPAALLVAALCGAVALGGTAAAADLDAPLGVGTEGPVRALFLDVTGADARIQDAPRVAFRWQMSNSWSAPTAFVRGPDVGYAQLDTQADAFTLVGSAPWRLLGRRVSTSLEARVTLFSGGWTDQPVETWHRALHFTNFQRQDYARNQVRLSFVDSHGGSAFNATAARWSFGHVTLRNQLLLADGGTSLRAGAGADRSRWALSLRLDAKVPAGSPSRLGDSGGFDAGLGLLATGEIARWFVLHANVFTSAWSDLRSDVALQPRRFHHGGELSAVFLLGRWAVIAEDRLLSPILASSWRTLGTDVYSDLAASAAFALTRMHNQISVGVRRGMVTAWFSEDFTPSGALPQGHWFLDSNAPDISFGVQIAHGL